MDSTLFVNGNFMNNRAWFSPNTAGNNFFLLLLLWAANFYQITSLTIEILNCEL